MAYSTRNSRVRLNTSINDFGGVVCCFTWQQRDKNDGSYKDSSITLNLYSREEFMSLAQSMMDDATAMSADVITLDGRAVGYGQPQFLTQIENGTHPTLKLLSGPETLTILAQAMSDTKSDEFKAACKAVKLQLK